MQPIRPPTGSYAASPTPAAPSLDDHSSLPQAEHANLLQEMGLDPEKIAQRKAFLELGDADLDRLTGLNELGQRYADEVIDEFYRHLLSFAEGREFFSDTPILEHVKQMQRRYFLRLTQGKYDLDYIEDRLRMGEVHERIGLPMRFYLGMYNFYLRAVAGRIFEADSDDPERALASFLSLMKLTFLDIGLAIDTYILQRERTIREQQEAIRELSTPVLQVRQGLLILPIIGVIDPQRARQLTEQLLHAIRATRAKVVVMDITGVATIDTAIANRFVQTVEASRLMGATVIVTGLSPEIAHTLVMLGMDLSKMRTVGDLQGGLEEAEQLLGYQVTRDGHAAGSTAQSAER